jgi:hypothetical protein
VLLELSFLPSRYDLFCLVSAEASRKTIQAGDNSAVQNAFKAKEAQVSLLFLFKLSLWSLWAKLHAHLRREVTELGLFVNLVRSQYVSYGRARVSGFRL